MEVNSSTFKKQLVERSEVLFNLESEYPGNCILNGLQGFARYLGVERRTDVQSSVYHGRYISHTLTLCKGFSKWVTNALVKYPTSSYVTAVYWG